jgi:hypothetical protein
MRKACLKMQEWRASPALFVHDVFNVELDSWQEEALMHFASSDPKAQRISLQACAGPGKSALLAMAGWHFLTTRGDKGEHPKAAAVSVTADNLKDNLWAEMSKWQDRSDLLKHLFTWTHSRIFAKDHPSTWFMSARSFAKTANAEEVGRTLSGLHSKYVLYLIDESGDIPPSIIKSAEQGLSTGPVFGKILQAGNPTSHDGMLYQAATRLREQWTIIQITGDPDSPRRSSRINIEWAREQIKIYGRDNPWVKAYILGEFPESNINTLLSLDEVTKAVNRQIPPSDYEKAQKRLGVDVGRFGGDRSVIIPRQGLRCFKPVVMIGARSNEIAARVALAKSKWKSEMEFIDGTGGFGSGVVDSLIQAGHSPQEIHFSGKAIDNRYYNKRSEMWFNMAEWIKRGGSIPDDDSLIKELCSPTYAFQNGRFLLEPKEQIKKRLGFSPDLCDALALTFAFPEMPGIDPVIGALMKPRYQSDYDPFNQKD